jgi:membrane-bound lytic murein transglycosylase B
VRGLAALAAALAAAVPPPPGAAIPRDPAALRAAYGQTTRALDAAVARWGGRGPVPRDAQLYALYQQRIVRLLARTPALAAAVPAARDEVAARVDLARLSAPYPPRKRIVLGTPRPPLVLRGWYAEAQRRFGVPWNVLAAVNFVESAFGKLRNDSVAGAQGPMQFMPATWSAYGLGGDVHDPHDAILGAANYLRANGAPRRLRDALWHYNPSRLYVDAVLRYARRIGGDRHAFLAYYARSVFVRTTAGERRVTGPR